MEHYERDLQPSVHKYTGVSSTSSSSKVHTSDADDDLLNNSYSTGEDGFKTVSRDFEFVYSKSPLN